VHHPHSEEADPAAVAALMRHGLPDELALRQVCWTMCVWRKGGLRGPIVGVA
jgi:hypothetical protein